MEVSARGMEVSARGVEVSARGMDRGAAARLQYPKRAETELEGKLVTACRMALLVFLSERLRVQSTFSASRSRALC